MLPPQYVYLNASILEWFGALPRFDNTSRHVWLQRVEQVGTHVVSDVVMGGRTHLSVNLDTSHLHSNDTRFISDQASLLFVSIADPDPANRAAADARIDPQFRSASRATFRFEGGRNTSDNTARVAWLESLAQNPTWIRIQVRSLHEFFPPASQIRKDVELATKEYLFSKLPRPQQPLILGPEFDAAVLSRGASINVSSIRTECNGRCWADDFPQNQCVDSNCDHPCCDPAQTVRPRFDIRSSPP
jgi:hypothetical protein